MKKRLLRLALCVLIAAVSIFSGCSSNEPGKPADTSEEKLAADQTIKLIGYDYTSLDPSVVTDTESYNTYQNVYEGLFKEASVDGVNTVKLAGASDMKVSSDRKVYTFTIRDSKWSDGKAVTANDYVFSWKRLIDPDMGNGYDYFLDCIQGAYEYRKKQVSFDEVGIKALDEKTLQVTLKEPLAFFEKMLAFGGLVPQREDISKQLGDKYGVDYSKMAYNGPFIVADYQKGSKIVYKKNDAYWDAANVKLMTAECSIVTEPATMLNMFKAKELDVVGAQNPGMITELKKLADAGEINYVTGILPSNFYYIFGCSRPVISNVKVRKALSLCVDRQEMLDVLYKRHVPAYGIIPPTMVVGDKEYRKVVEEPLAAVLKENLNPKDVLMEGLKELNISAPSKVKLMLWMGEVTTSQKARAEYAQKQWQDKLGIQIEIKYAPDGPTYFKERQNGNFDICLGGWGSDFNDIYSMLEYLRSDNGNNNGKYSNKEFDELVNKSFIELDPSKRIEYFKEAERLIVAEDFAVAPIYYQDIQSFRQKGVKGFIIPLYGGYYYLKDTYIVEK